MAYEGYLYKTFSEKMSEVLFAFVGEGVALDWYEPLFSEESHYESSL